MRQPPEILDATLSMIASVFEGAGISIEDLHGQTFILLALGDWLDEHGFERSVLRIEAEDDASYRERIRTFADAVTLPALTAAIGGELAIGPARIEEWLADGVWLAPNGSPIESWFLGDTTLYGGRIGVSVEIPEQSATTHDTTWLIPNGPATPILTLFPDPELTGAGTGNPPIPTEWAFPAEAVFPSVVRSVSQNPGVTLAVFFVEKPPFWVVPVALAALSLDLETLTLSGSLVASALPFTGVIATASERTDGTLDLAFTEAAALALDIPTLSGVLFGRIGTDAMPLGTFFVPDGASPGTSWPEDPGAFVDSQAREPSDVYAAIRDAIDRTRAAGVEVRVFIETNTPANMDALISGAS